MRDAWVPEWVLGVHHTVALTHAVTIVCHRPDPVTAWTAAPPVQ